MTDTVDLRDKIIFSLRTEEMVTNHTVKIIATISAAITRKTDDTLLQIKVRELMQAFMPNADWQYSGMNRTRHPSAMETVQLTATTRIKESEASHLDERAQSVQIQFEGCSFNISKIQTDNSFPTSLVDEVESRMRLALIVKAREECDLINKTLKGGSELYIPYHVARIDFESDDVQHRALSLSNANTRVYAQSAGAFAGGESDGALGNTQKIQMAAQISLAL